MKKKKGEFLVVTDGDYSRYHIVAFYVLLEDIDIKKLWEDFKAEYSQGDIKYQFLNWMVNTKKCIKGIDCGELNLLDL